METVARIPAWERPPPLGIRVNPCPLVPTQGTIPEDLFAFMGALSYLDLSYNMFSGTLPWTVGWARGRGRGRGV